MVDRIRIISFGVIVIVALLLTPSAAEPCDIKADVCEYKLIVDYQLTMTKDNYILKAVKGKLYPAAVVNTNTANPIPEDEVIIMDGYEDSQLVVAVNGTIPGPAIEAYIGQTLIVNVENHLYSSDVTIHWHGMHQKGTPYMDGVPYVTQCPIGPSQSFTYKFNLTQTGTYWYHSHVGTQLTMGFFGAFIIREKEMTIREHFMVISEYNHKWEANIAYLRMMRYVFALKKPAENNCSSDESAFSLSGLVNGRGRFYLKPGVQNEAPLAKFTVKQGQQYRFRVIAAGSVPFDTSVDGHKLQIVASDGYELEPQMADVFIINPGERFDFIITANQTIGNYWIRGITLSFGVKVTFEAILHYEGAPDEDPKSAPKDCSENDPCVVLNCESSFYPMGKHRKCVLFSELKSGFDYEVPPIASGKWKEYFLNFAIPGVPGNNPSSVNGRKFKEPSVNALYQPKEIDTLCDKQDCGVDRLCTCTHSLKLDKGYTIQMVFLNMGSGKGVPHPIHMHGHTFSVVKMGYPIFNETTGEVIASNPDIDCRGDPKKNYCNDAAWTNSNWGGDNIPGLKLERAPMKDTLNIPSGAYAIIRIKADNPGLWFMHCHIESHALNGMAMMLNESFADVPEAPDHFPVCRSFTPEAIGRIPTVRETNTTPPVGLASIGLPPLIHPKQEREPKEDKEVGKMAFGILIAVICALILIILILIVVLARRIRCENTHMVSGSKNAGFVN